eukprot:10328255-Karenia_brevis.AAC.1
MPLRMYIPNILGCDCWLDGWPVPVVACCGSGSFCGSGSGSVLAFLMTRSLNDVRAGAAFAGPSVTSRAASLL